MFPFRKWLLKPSTNTIITLEEECFNYCLSRARMVTDGAYDKLMGR